MSTNTNIIDGNLYVLNDPTNPASSQSAKVNPSTTLDQVYDQTNIDNTTSKYKTLRKILEDLEELIHQGGDITFPVTSVNGKSGYNDYNDSDVELTAMDIKFEGDTPIYDAIKTAQDNTQEMSIAMGDLRDLVINILNQLENHVANYANPHNVSVDSINSNGRLTEFVARLITDHLNDSSLDNSHGKLRELIDHLSSIVGSPSSGNTMLAQRVTSVGNRLTQHMVDTNPHAMSFATKEDLDNKINIIVESAISSTDGKYPTVYAVSEYIKEVLNAYTFPGGVVSNIIVVGADQTVKELPTANLEEYKKKNLYVLPDGLISAGYSGSDGKMQIARVVEDTSSGYTSYRYEITTVGPYSTFDSRYFRYSNIKGLTILVDNLIDDIYSQRGRIQATIASLVNQIIDYWMRDYYTKSDIDSMNLIGNVELKSGRNVGTVQLVGTKYENGAEVPFIYEVYVNGLKRLAYMDKVETNLIDDGAVTNSKIGQGQVTGDKIANTTITSANLSLPYNHIYGNMFNEDTNEVEPIDVYWFADFVINRFIEYFDFSVIDDQTIIEDAAEIYARIVGELDPTNTLNFYLEDDGDMVMTFPGIYAEYHDPDVRVEDGNLVVYLDDDDANLTIIEKILKTYEFFIQDDNLYMKVPVSYATLSRVTIL